MTAPLTSMPDETLVFRLIAPGGESFSLPIVPGDPLYATLEPIHRDAVFAVYRAVGLRSRCAGDMSCEVITARTLKLIERQDSCIKALTRSLAETESMIPGGMLVAFDRSDDPGSVRHGTPANNPDYKEEQ